MRFLAECANVRIAPLPFHLQCCNEEIGVLTKFPDLLSCKVYRGLFEGLPLLCMEMRSLCEVLLRLRNSFLQYERFFGSHVDLQEGDVSVGDACAGFQKIFLESVQGRVLRPFHDSR